MQTTLIADSGSTKTAWILLVGGQVQDSFDSAGLNPIHLGLEAFGAALAQIFADRPELLGVARVFFYGAGCTPAYVPPVEAALRTLFRQAEVQAHSDLLGAARALCGRQAGIACILGTGSNSCAYDGEQIVAQVSPLGFILGDEGSGAVLGRCLLGDFLKGQMPELLRETFGATYALTSGDIIERVYRQPLPARFLAGFAPFLYEHRATDYVQRLLHEQFEAFFRRNVKQYAPHLRANIVGSIGYFFETEVRRAAESVGIVVDKVVRSPLTGLADYHAEVQK